MIESGAIRECLMARYGGGNFAVDPHWPDYPNYVQFMHFAEGTDPANETLELWPNVRCFLTEMHERPAYQCALKVTMPDGPPPRF